MTITCIFAFVGVPGKSNTPLLRLISFVGVFASSTGPHTTHNKGRSLVWKTNKGENINSHNLQAMIKLHFTFLCLLLMTKTEGQQYETDFILKKADSVLISKIGQRIFNDYYAYDSNSYYEFTGNNGERGWRGLTRDKITMGIFNKISVRYKFRLAAFKTRGYVTSVNFDSLLNLKDTLNTVFIPQYVWNNTASSFISEQQALAIAKRTFMQPVVVPVSVHLEYSYSRKKHIWSASNIFCRSKVETVEIDALTSQIISHDSEFFVLVDKKLIERLPACPQH